jgi:acetyl esterase/lipase
MLGWIFLVVVVVVFASTVNAFAPTKRNKVVFLPSFFLSWLTNELAGWWIAIQVVLTVGVVAVGGADAWPGRIGVALLIANWVLLVALVLRGRSAAVTMREALVDLVGDEPGPRIPKWHVWLPLVMKRKGVTRTKDVEFARVAGRRLKLDVYQPSAAAAPGDKRRAIVQIHGGGWVMGDKREQGIPLLTHLAANGWVGFNANYRLSPAATWPDHLVDCKRAIAWVREHAHEYGIDPDFIAVTGGSAGGHLTALVALTSDDQSLQPGFEHADTSVQAAVPFYGVYDLTDRNQVQLPGFVSLFLEPWVMKSFLEDEPERWAAASPLDRVHPDAPPFLIVHGDKDTLAPLVDAQQFAHELREVSDAPVVFAELHGAQHAFDVFLSPRTAPVVEGAERFLWAVHRDWAAGADEAGEGIVDDATLRVDPDTEVDEAEVQGQDGAEAVVGGS